MGDKNMLKEIHFAFYAIKKNIQGSAELRTSFLMNVIGMAINNIAFIILWVYFIKAVGIIGGWTAVDIIGLQGFVALSYGAVFSIGAGLRKLPDYVSSGAFDRFMLSPKNLLVRIATASFNASAIGDILFGTVCLAIYGFLIHISLIQIAVVIIMAFFAIVTSYAAAIMIYSTGFLFIDSGSFTSGLGELFLTPALFHGGAFQGAMRFIFTFLMPSLLIGTLPVEAVKSLSVGQMALVGVLSSAWFLISIKFFEKVLKKYESSNFMTFGN